MDPIPSKVETSFNRCATRRRATMMLSSLGEAGPTQLGKAIGVAHTRLRWIMEGHEPQYSVELAPVTLGLATIREEPKRRVYVITNHGRKVSRRFAARFSRASRRAAAVRASDEAFRAGRPEPGESQTGD
jgi:predicted transcriptional regulator with HTH domain